MQKALIVGAHYKAGFGAAVEELNNHLKDGWKLVSMSAMSGTQTETSLALVILEKEEPRKKGSGPQIS